MLSEQSPEELSKVCLCFDCWVSPEYTTLNTEALHSAIPLEGPSETLPYFVCDVRDFRSSPTGELVSSLARPVGGEVRLFPFKSSIFSNKFIR